MHKMGLLVLLLFQTSIPGKISSAPESPGVYVFQMDRWIPLALAKIAESETKGLRNYVYTDGYTNLNVFVAYSGSKAPIRLSSYKSAFFVRQTGSAVNFAVIRLESKGNNRSLRTTPSEGSSDNKLGFPKSAIVKMDITKYEDHSFSATPEKPLKPGEYLVIFDTITSGYDFGVD